MSHAYAHVMLSAPPALGPLSQDVYKVMARHTAFPWPIIKTQCRRNGVDPRGLTPTTLGFVIQSLALGISRFTDAQTAMRVRRELVEVMRNAR